MQVMIPPTTFPMRTFTTADIDAMDSWLPGVHPIRLKPSHDQRGTFTEVHRADWKTGCDPLQWNLDHSKARTLRGMHAHRTRFDYVTPVCGRVVIGLYDARPDTPSQGRSAVISLSKEDSVALILPPGVLHGFYYPEDSAVLIGFSQYWSPGDDIRCHYLCPELGLVAWAGQVDHISTADASAPLFTGFLHDLHGKLPGK